MGTNKTTFYVKFTGLIRNRIYLCFYKKKCGFILIEENKFYPLSTCWSKVIKKVSHND